MQEIDNITESTKNHQSIGGGSESHFEARNLEIIDRGVEGDEAANAAAVTLDLDTTTSVI